MEDSTIDNQKENTKELRPFFVLSGTGLRSFHVDVTRLISRQLLVEVVLPGLMDEAQAMLDNERRAREAAEEEVRGLGRFVKRFELMASQMLYSGRDSSRRADRVRAITLVQAGDPKVPDDQIVFFFPRGEKPQVAAPVPAKAASKRRGRKGKRKCGVCQSAEHDARNCPTKPSPAPEPPAEKRAVKKSANAKKKPGRKKKK